MKEATSKRQVGQFVEGDLKGSEAALTRSTAKDEGLLKEYSLRAHYTVLASIHCTKLTHRKKNSSTSAQAIFPQASW